MAKLCECGCKGKVNPKARFISGHHTRLAVKLGKPPRTYKPTPDEIPSGLCECGCGQRTEIATKTVIRKREFKGFPKPFVGQHRQRVTINKGEQHHLWKGGRYLRRGYVMVYNPEHPNADGKGYVPEHRLVVEQVIGRYLESSEVVHHINGDKSDNRPENLEILSNSEHSRIHNKADHMRKFVTKELLSKWGKMGAARRWNK